MVARPGSRVRRRISRIHSGSIREISDSVVTEEPMEIRLETGSGSRPIVVTMRTPGNDFELAAGFLFAEGVISGRAAVESIVYCLDEEVSADQHYNVVSLRTRGGPDLDLSALERNFFVSSACGVCGKASLEALAARQVQPVRAKGPLVNADTLLGLPRKLRDRQSLFSETGGLHAAGLFGPEGEFLALREDVGRHNAVDKLIGWALLEDRLPLEECILLVSGRASYEILQKSAAAGVPIVCSISAPSSLAVDLARAFNITLVGFLRGQGFNIYSRRRRILPQTEAAVTLTQS